MKDVYSISQQIQERITLLGKVRQVIKERGEKRADSIRDYDKQLAVTIIKLKNGIPMELDGQTIEKPQTTILEKIAKGICFDAKHKMELADAEYKSAITNLNTIQCELSALQSIYRNME